MISGHFATALIAKNYAKKGSIWLYLLAAQGLDILMFSFVLVGFESLELGSSLFPALGSATVDMRYSHDLVPVLMWTVVMFVIALGVSKNMVVSFWCSGLIIVHEICDLVTGYSHNIMGPNTSEFGLKLWVVAPYTGTFIESALGVGCVYLYAKYNPLPSRSKVILYAILGVTPFLLLPLVLR
jgi:hypothetical protein